MTKSLKLISFVFSISICFIAQAQQKEDSNVKPVNPNNPIIICAPSKNSLVNKPSVVLDGVVIDPEQFSKVPPNEIKDIKVLKEIEATKIYGMKGINGAIVITTKNND